MKDEFVPSAKVGMLIRRPVDEVFEAFVDPDITSKFWFTRGSGRLREGEAVRWDWEMYGVSGEVEVKALQENERILVEWLTDGTSTTVEWIFTPGSDTTTFVSITNDGFGGDEREVVEQAIDATEGFTQVLAGAKAFLEHGIVLNLVADRYPDGIGQE